MIDFIVYFQKGYGAPSREPVFSEEERRQMMAYAYRKQEELKVGLCGTNPQKLQGGVQQLLMKSIEDHCMAAQRYEISLLMLKIFSSEYDTSDEMFCLLYKHE